MTNVPYHNNLHEGRLPSFRIRGWDDGTVWVDIYCRCGRHFYDDDGQPLSETGTVTLVCPRCKTRHTVIVTAYATETTE